MDTSYLSISPESPQLQPNLIRRSAPASLDRACRTGLAIRAGRSLRRLAISNTLEEVADASNAEQASVLDGGSVYTSLASLYQSIFTIELTSVVTVHAGDKLSLVYFDAIKGTLARNLRAAVTAATVQLADVLRIEVLDCDGAAAIVLEDFVFGPLCTSSIDIGGAGFLLECSSVLADINPP